MLERRTVQRWFAARCRRDLDLEEEVSLRDHARTWEGAWTKFRQRLGCHLKAELLLELAARGNLYTGRRLLFLFDQARGELPNARGRVRVRNRRAAPVSKYDRRPQRRAQIDAALSLGIDVVRHDDDRVDQPPVDLVVNERRAALAVGINRDQAPSNEAQKSWWNGGADVLDELESNGRQLGGHDAAQPVLRACPGESTSG